jgi:hypothetical protein
LAPSSPEVPTAITATAPIAIRFRTIRGVTMDSMGFIKKDMILPFSIYIPLEINIQIK